MFVKCKIAHLKPANALFYWGSGKKKPLRINTAVMVLIM